MGIPLNRPLFFLSELPMSQMWCMMVLLRAVGARWVVCSGIGERSRMNVFRWIVLIAQCVGAGLKAVEVVVRKDLDGDGVVGDRRKEVPLDSDK